MRQASIFDNLKEEIERRELEEARKVRKSDVVLRPYQVESVDRVFEEWKDSRATLVCLPTGCGKSVVFSDVMRRWFEQ